MSKTTPPPPAVAPFPYKINDPEEFARNVLRLVEEGTRAMTDLMERADAKPSPFSPASEMAVATETLTKLSEKWMAYIPVDGPAQPKQFRHAP